MVFILANLLQTLIGSFLCCCTLLGGFFRCNNRKMDWKTFCESSLRSTVMLTVFRFTLTAIMVLF